VTDRTTVHTSATSIAPGRALPGPGTIAKRAALGAMAIIAVLSALGWTGNLLLFDGAAADQETRFLRWVADNRVGALDFAATVASALSDTRTVIGVLVGSVTMLIAAGYRHQAAAVFLAVAVKFSTFLAVGQIVGRARPEVEPLGAVPSTPSFPSGHVAAALVLHDALVLAARSIDRRRTPRSIWVVPVVAAFVVVAARLYEGVHFPTDVVAGLAVGAGALCVAGIATGLLVVRDGRFHVVLTDATWPDRTTTRIDTEA